MDEKTGGNGSQKKVVSAEDRLQAENLQLRLMNLQLQEKLLVAKLGALQEEKAGVQQMYVEHQKHLEMKYEVDFSKMEMRAGDGTIVPSGSTPSGLIR